tara:strand:- start:4640 stop:4897 length:258 start_codon:yes stop_codon:yes gene_type:complete
VHNPLNEGFKNFKTLNRLRGTTKELKMPDIEKTECHYCGSQFLVIFEEEEEVIKYCPSCGEKIEDYIDHDNDGEGDLWDVDWEEE